MPKTPETKSATVTLFGPGSGLPPVRKKAIAEGAKTIGTSCKGSTRFETTGDSEGVVDNLYLDRLAALKHLGIPDTDKVVGIKVTIEPVYELPKAA